MRYLFLYGMIIVIYYCIKHDFIDHGIAECF